MPKRALIIVDVQQVYFSGGVLPIAYPRREESFANIGTAMDAAREAGVPVVVVRHTSPAGSPAFDRDTHQWELHPDVGERRADHTVEKHTSSAFFGTDLAEWLAARDIDTVAVAGYMTQNCDFATSFDAHAHGLRVELLSDATGTLPLTTPVGSLSAEQVHETMLVVLSSNIASVHTTADWCVAVKAGEALTAPNIIEATAPARALEEAVA